MRYLVVIFKESNLVELISEGWLLRKDECWYPIKGNIARMARKHKSPNEDWKVFSIRIIILYSKLQFKIEFNQSDTLSFLIVEKY